MKIDFPSKFKRYDIVIDIPDKGIDYTIVYIYSNYYFYKWVEDDQVKIAHMKIDEFDEIHQLKVK